MDKKNEVYDQILNQIEYLLESKKTPVKILIKESILNEIGWKTIVKVGTPVGLLPVISVSWQGFIPECLVMCDE